MMITPVCRRGLRDQHVSAGWLHPVAALVSTKPHGVQRSMANAPMSSPEKDPEDWVTRDEPMTGPQHSYLQTLAREAGEDVPADLTKAQASELIDRLQQKTGRGR
jgi:hypothetical protein